jgi:hypothetical protein
MTNQQSSVSGFPEISPRVSAFSATLRLSGCALFNDTLPAKSNRPYVGCDDCIEIVRPPRPGDKE